MLFQTVAQSLKIRELSRCHRAPWNKSYWELTYFSFTSHNNAEARLEPSDLKIFMSSKLIPRSFVKALAITLTLGCF